MMGDLQKRIISHLRDDSRKSLSKIAREEKFAVSTIFDGLNRIKDSELITRFVSLVDFSSLGFPFRAFLFCDQDKFDEVSHLFEDDGPVNAMTILNKGTFMVDMLFSSLDEEDKFLESLDGFGSDWWTFHRVIDTVALEKWKPE